MRAEIPATERLTLGVSGVTDNTPTVYLDANGNVVSKKELSSQQKKLLNDYRLIQYDMTAGKTISAAQVLRREVNRQATPQNWLSA